MIFKHRRGFWNLENKILIAGILNVTPDSFSDGGKFFLTDSALRRAKELVNEGADFIDIGGESTRPGAENISAEEESRRVTNVISMIRKDRLFDSIPISIDTCKYDVALVAIDCGADIINDISAFCYDHRMFDLASSSGAGVILMHMQGTPQTMQANPHYEDLLTEISDFLYERFCMAVDNKINPENIVLDPGIGFGKTVAQNFEIIKNISLLKENLNRPILIGCSRKSLIGKTLDLPVEERMPASVVLAALSAINGARILRVHDVKETRQALKMLVLSSKYFENFSM